MQGHAAGDRAITFYGTSFIADHTGAVVAETCRTAEGMVTAAFDLDAVAKARALRGVFRDRRPEMYGPMGSLESGPWWKVRANCTRAGFRPPPTNAERPRECRKGLDCGRPYWRRRCRKLTRCRPSELCAWTLIRESCSDPRIRHPDHTTSVPPSADLVGLHWWP